MPFPLNPDDQLISIGADHKARHFSSRASLYRLDRGWYLLLNPISGAVDLLSEREKRSLRAALNGHPLRDPVLAEYFARRGYLYPSRLEEDRTFKAAVTPPPGIEAWGFHIFLGSRCNFVCPYCFEKDLPKTNKTMGTKELELIYRAIAGIVKKTRVPPDRVAIKIFGGEPLLPEHRKAVNRILKLAARAGYLCTITTNGYLLGDYLALFKKYQKVIRFFHVSLDGPPEVHDRSRLLKGGGSTFDAITQNIDRALKGGFKVLLRTNFTAQTIPRLPELIKAYEKLKWHKQPNLLLQFSPIFNMLKTSRRQAKIDYQAIYQKLRPLLRHIAKRFAWPAVSNFFGWYIGNYLGRILGIELYYQEIGSGQRYRPQFYACPANSLNDLQFYPDGNIYPCNVIAGRPGHAIGRFMPKLQLAKRKCRQWLDRNILTIKPCRDCAVSAFCGGGCVVSSASQGYGYRRVNCNGYFRELRSFIRRHRGKILKNAKNQF